ncbi:S8/S53 family peptidase [Clostridioides difficile]|uniref:S8/S53 family peptidase n=1 Tax=Clostridioides difficile TaxID=1496 RepID=UPI0021CBCCDF|nr:S8/S53 family peptidase [Clostridioides difficile]MCU5874019.1 S8/S53 family peptidase [Clostridioides difficile]MCU5899938.1 S8/S53 family peptidase [Clostridioides difficile]MCV2273115.1 S8/S53 family peptidase [Clostridioides difficile]MDL0416726.1 S8/S53 family peptidase [Clostridioides difficile]MDV9709317.1 S8/S53 family peptidase [Clostridioides difficile]
MNNVKVAVLDTGIDMEDNEIKKFCKLDKNLQIQSINECIDDLNGHGTFVSKTIINICKNIDIYPIKIFNKFGRTNSLNAILVLRKILNSEIDIINISASTFDYSYENEFRDICNKLKSKNKIVICSKHNSREVNNSIPTIFDSVIGVEGHRNIYENSQYVYKKNNKVQMLANNKESFVKFKGSIVPFGKNSKACAIATGIIANILKHNPGIYFNQLEEILLSNSLDENKLCTSHLLDIKSYNNLNQEHILYINKGILEIINNNFAVKKVNFQMIQEYGIMNTITNIGKHNAYDFLELINEYFDININYKDIFLYNLNYIEKLLPVILLYLN